MSLYLEVDKFTFETILCPSLGYVSSKACEHCRVRSSGKCPKNKDMS